MSRPGGNGRITQFSIPGCAAEGTGGGGGHRDTTARREARVSSKEEGCQGDTVGVRSRRM